MNWMKVLISEKWLNMWENERNVGDIFVDISIGEKEKDKKKNVTIPFLVHLSIHPQSTNVLHLKNPLK